MEFALQLKLNANCCLADGRGRNFDIVLRHELHKISAFYVDKEEELEVGFPICFCFIQG